MATAYIYNLPFLVREGETLRYREVAADGTISPEVTKTYEELLTPEAATYGISLTPSIGTAALTGIAPADAVSLTPEAGVAGLTGTLAADSANLTPSIAAAALVGALAADSMTVTPQITAGDAILSDAPVAADSFSVTPSIASAALTGTLSADGMSITPQVGEASLTGTLDAASISVTPQVGAGDATAAASAPYPAPQISATGDDTTVSIALTNSVTGATEWSIKWDTVSHAGDGLYANTIDWATIQAATSPDFPASEFVHTGRTNGTTYYYSLVATNAQGSTESAEVSGAATAPAAAVTETFETVSVGSLPKTGVAGVWSGSATITTVSPHAGTKSLDFYAADGGSTDASIAFTGQAAGTLDFWLYYPTSNGGSTFRVYRNGTEIYSTSATNVEYTHVTVSPSYPLASNTFRFELAEESYEGQAHCFIDDITWTPSL